MLIDFQTFFTERLTSNFLAKTR